MAVNDAGEILLTPLVSIPKRELIVWENEQLRASLACGLADSAAGKAKDLPDFSAFVDDEDDDEADDASVKPELFKLKATDEASGVLADLGAAEQYAKKLAKVRRTLGRLQQDPRHPGLNSHKYNSISGTVGEEVWESYVENKTPGAWRVFWHDGPGQRVITVVSIGPHP